MNNVAMAQAVQAAVKPKFYGHSALHSKVATHFPEGVVREYIRVTNTYMTLLNKEIAARLPAVRQAIDAERDGQRNDADSDLMSLISKTFMAIWEDFEKKAEGFGLERKLANLAKLTRKLTIREWKRVVHKTLGINLLDDYYMGEFFREAMKLWTQNNVNLIKTIPRDTLSAMQNIVQEGYTAGRSNTSIGRDIQHQYGINRRHAQFIARDQIAKLNANLTQAQQTDAGVEEYVWSTSEDERVRHRHAELNGKTFKWSDPPIVDTRTGRRGHPGEDYQCRCVALPKFNLPELSLPWEHAPTQRKGDKG
jgi:SPP1 gp7 family putative phage head morphogenesis protein